MAFRRSAPAILALAIISAMAILLTIQTRISDHLVDTYDRGQFALVGDITATALRQTEASALMIAETISSAPDVQQAFLAGDRAKLLALTEGDFAVLHDQHGISQAQFHTAPATSFLRLHEPADYGDDQSAFRYMVVDAIKTASPRHGIEMTLSGVDIFATVPVFGPSKQVLGSFEVGVELEGVLDDIKMDHCLEVAAYFNEEKLRTVATNERPEVFSEENRVGSYLNIYATHPELFRSLVTAQDIAVVEDTQYIRDYGGRSYGILLQPVFNMAHVQIGIIAAIKEFTEDRVAFKTGFIYEAFASVAVGVALISIMLLVLNGMILRPMAVLRDRLAARLDGAALPEERLDPKDRWAAEIADVLRYTDQLEARLDQSDAAGRE